MVDWGSDGSGDEECAERLSRVEHVEHVERE